ncbi:hypothetical protein AGLY_017073 [Aphis glycines]|uniref:HAT C-terminal dimerisation domain-containing protein n=1 Tax=Aphis glycines TaxID=307491 RepID=A0A6G0SVX8_APHGL|nr:hypothetical protein AGLY_017073 [Aphis glycines]
MVCTKDIEEITEIITVLRPLEAATKELCGEQYVSSSMVIPIVHILQTKIDEATTSQILSTQLKNALKFEFSLSKMLTKISEEIKSYEETSESSSDSSNATHEYAVGRLTDGPLLLWNDMSTVYSTLSKVALKYLSTVATSVPSERLFSKAGLIMNQQRNRLTNEKLNMLLFLQSVDERF